MRTWNVLLTLFLAMATMAAKLMTMPKMATVKQAGPSTQNFSLLIFKIPFKYGPTFTHTHTHKHTHTHIHIQAQKMVLIREILLKGMVQYS
jgi:hypothetical protein